MLSVFRYKASVCWCKAPIRKCKAPIFAREPLVGRQVALFCLKLKVAKMWICKEIWQMKVENWKFREAFWSTSALKEGLLRRLGLRIKAPSQSWKLKLKPLKTLKYTADTALIWLCDNLLFYQLDLKPLWTLLSTAEFGFAQYRLHLGKEKQNVVFLFSALGLHKFVCRPI